MFLPVSEFQPSSVSRAERGKIQITRISRRVDRGPRRPLDAQFTHSILRIVPVAIRILMVSDYFSFGRASACGRRRNRVQVKPGPGPGSESDRAKRLRADYSTASPGRDNIIILITFGYQSEFSRLRAITRPGRFASIFGFARARMRGQRHLKCSTE